MTEIESKIEENTDSQYLLVAFTTNPFLSDIECGREFARHQQACLNGNKHELNQPDQLA